MLTAEQKQKYDDDVCQKAAVDASKRFSGSIPDDVYELMSQSLVEDLHRQMEDAGRGFVLREDAERTRANRWLVDNAVIHSKYAVEASNVLNERSQK